MGFKAVPHEPYAFMKDSMVIFFYMDDLVIAYRKQNQLKVDLAVEELKKHYTLQGGDELQWFLRVEVIRDRSKKLIWLSQSDYISKLANLVDKTDTRYPSTPMTDREWLPFDGRASEASINCYQ